MTKQKIFCAKTYYETKVFKIVLARYRRKFVSKFLDRFHIFKSVKSFEARETCEDLTAIISDNRPNTRNECVCVINFSVLCVHLNFI